MVEEYKKELQDRLGKLPLDKNIRIGIYGTGEHTDNLLKWYEILVGAVQADLFFIDSHKKSLSETYKGYDIYNADDLEDASPEAVIISSQIHEMQMKENVVKKYGNKYPLYLFYEKEEKGMFRYTAILEAHLKKKPGLKLKFVDFWPGFVAEDNIVTRLLSEYFTIDISDEPDLLIYNHFGKKHLLYDCKKMLWITEACEYKTEEYDYAVGFPYINANNFFHFNTYIPARLYGIKRQYSDDYAKRQFCNFIYSNETCGEGAKLRKEFCEKLSSTYKRVDCPGKVLNNMDNAEVGGRNDNNWGALKESFIAGYKFTIAFENHQVPGYATEKLWGAFMAGSVPIYWGDPEICVRTGVNQEAFINCNGCDISTMIEKIRQVDNDDEKYMYMLRQSPFKNKSYSTREVQEFLYKAINN